MSNYNDKKKNKKKIAKENIRKARQARRSKAIKAQHKSDKEVEKLKWEHRERLTPIRKPKEDA